MTATSPLTGSVPADLAPVWAELVGQDDAIAILSQAAASTDSHAMTHAWLFTGPPGCGRSNAARAFAAALQCDDHGCGVCTSCRTVFSGAHPDLTVVNTEKLSIGVDQVRHLVGTAAMAPGVGRYQIIIVEDCDRITVQGADALLKSLEEPPATTVWLLCAPTPDDVIVTVRSRTRALGLHTPSVDDVAAVLARRDGVDPKLARRIAKASQGHIGWARALATDPEARRARETAIAIPERLTGITACLDAAQTLIDIADEQAKQRSERLDAREIDELKDALGFDTKGVSSAQARKAIKELEAEQAVRATRFKRDALDRFLTELATWYRDVLTVQLCGPSEVTFERLINAETDRIVQAAGSGSPQRTLNQLDAIAATRRALGRNAAPNLALEALMITLATGNKLAT